MRQTYATCCTAGASIFPETSVHVPTFPLISLYTMPLANPCRSELSASAHRRVVAGIFDGIDEWRSLVGVDFQAVRGYYRVQSIFFSVELPSNCTCGGRRVVTSVTYSASEVDEKNGPSLAHRHIKSNKSWKCISVHTCVCHNGKIWAGQDIIRR